MITAEMVEQAKRNIDEQNAKKLGLYRFHFTSFAIGLAVGLIICGALLIVLL
jgi:hypothetical protein